jgi:hypothetical protein
LADLEQMERRFIETNYRTLEVNQLKVRAP